MLTWRAKLVITYGSWHCLVIAVYSIVFRATSYVAILTDGQSHKVFLICVPCICSPLESIHTGTALTEQPDLIQATCACGTKLSTTKSNVLHACIVPVQLCMLLIAIMTATYAQWDEQLKSNKLAYVTCE